MWGVARGTPVDVVGGMDLSVVGGVRFCGGGEQSEHGKGLYSSEASRRKGVMSSIYDSALVLLFDPCTSSSTALTTRNILYILNTCLKKLSFLLFKVP